MSTTKCVLMIAISLQVISCAEHAELGEKSEGRDLAPGEQAVVQGEDERELIDASRVLAYPWRTVAAFRPTSGRATASCTAFKVGPRHLLTAAHCFESRDDNGDYLVKATRSTVRLVFGQLGSGNAAENMPVDGRKVTVEDVYIPEGWSRTQGDNREHDWALIRLADADSSRGWFQVLARNDDDVLAESDVFVTGYPLDRVTGNGSGTDSPCAASPLEDARCGGFQYQAPAAIRAHNATYFELATDWDRGQSGGPIYTDLPNTRQKSAIALVSLNNAGKNVAHRITPVIADKVCEQVRAHPSSLFPNHECGQ